MAVTKPVLIVFVKNPELGKVKTRLAQGVGDEMALRIYKALLEHTKKITLAAKAERLLFYSDHIALKDGWSTADFHKYLQSDGGLGDRMSKAFEQSFKHGNPVLIIGSDCAQMDISIIEKGIEQLAHHDFVVGPAEDGGYYLLGMRDFRPCVFENITWSTESVLASTLNVMDINKWSYYLLPELSDIDYIEDWEKHGWDIH